MTTAGPVPDRSRNLGGIIAGLLAVALLVRILTAAVTPYEFHRDEFLYFSMGTHLRLFHMDFPPMIALLSELLRHTVGVSVFTYRLLPGIVATAILLLALLTARALGAGRLGVLLTGLAMLGGALFLRAGSLFQPVVLDQLWWTLALYALLRLEQTDDPRWWWALGLAGGLGLLTKFSIAFIGLGVVAAILLTPRRKAFLGPGPWIALLIVLVLGSPSVIGQITQHFPVLDQMQQLKAGQLDRVTWREYLGMQPLMLGPVILLAVAGAVGPFADRRLRAFRAPALACVVTFLLLGFLHGKPYYAGPIYPVLLAAGATWLDFLARPRLRLALAWSVAVLTGAYLAISVPLGLPVVPPAPMAAYAARLGITAATQTNRGTQLPLPQDYADMLGWKEKVEAVAKVYDSLTPDEQRRTVLYGHNYGQAGALDLYGRRLGLPPVVSRAGSFYLFGPGERPGDVVILLGVEADDLGDFHCGSLQTATRVRNPWAVEEEQDVPVLLCRDPNMTMQEVWARHGPEWG
ncbi:MAG: glycosyltransferase family 39 protein [Gemmatimonadetes bacterium]|nr:glycosyltransferase family 39 protein [Gemmatimonadota bacterium]